MGKQALLIILLVSGLLYSGCSRKTAGFTTSSVDGKDYDTAKYEYIFTEGVKQKLLGNPGEAIKLFEQCIYMNPGSDGAYYQISQILLQNGDIQNGKRYCMKALNADEKNIWYLTLMAGIYYQEKNLDSSALLYEKILEYYPARDEIRLTLGNIYAEKGDNKKAGLQYDYLENKYGVNETITISQVKNLINSNQFESAEIKIKALIEENPEELIYSGMLAEIYRRKGENGKALEVYQKLMLMDSGNPQTLMSLSDFLLETKNFEELLSMLNTVILNEKITKEDKISLIAQCLDNDSLMTGNGDDYEVVVRVLEAMYPGDNVVNMVRPEYYIKTGKLDQAIGRLESLIAESPDNYFAWEKLLLLYSETGSYDKLLIKGEECATKFNRSYLAKILYASAAIEKGKYDIAAEEIRKAKILAGDQKELLIQALAMEADLYYRKKEYGKSFSLFKEAVKLNPSDVTVLNNYAYYLAEQGQELKEAEDMARRVIEIEKDNTTFLDTYAWVLYKRGKIKEAATIMESIMSSGKEDADWFEHYGFIMKAMKKCGIAVTYWKRAISLEEKRQYLLKEIENCSEKN